MYGNAQGSVVLTVDPGAKVPPLPRRKQGWKASTREWWNAVWRSPMASQYLDVDRSPLARLAAIKEQIDSGDERGALYSAAAKLEDAFGLSPYARARLRWQIASPSTTAENVDLTLAARRAQRRRVAEVEEGNDDV